MLKTKTIIKLLRKLKNKPNRKAKYISVLIFYDPMKKIEIYTYGELKGIIGNKEKGAQGFGYDPLFKIKKYKHNHGRNFI